MKQTVLSIEQMQHLQDLGLDISDASMFYYRNWILDFSGEWDGYIDKPSYFYSHKEMLNHIDECLPAYTLQDILENHLFKLEFKTADDFVQFGMDDISVWIEDFQSNIQNEISYEEAGDSLNAAYQLLCWCIEKGYIKTKQP